MFGWLGFSVVLLSTLGASHPALAGSDYWSPQAASGSWSNGHNWGFGGIFSGAIPGATSGTANTDTATFNGGSFVTSIAPDANRNLENITFDASPAAYTIGTIGGNALLMTAGGTIQVASTFSSSNITETVNAPLTLEGSYTFANNSTNAGVALNFGGAVTSAQSGSQTLTVSGSGATTINGPIGGGAGTIGLTMNGNGTLAVGGNNTFTGGVTINSGNVVLNNAGAVNSANPNAVTLNNSGNLDLNGQSITLAGLSGGVNSIVQNISVSAPATLTVNEAAGKTDSYYGIVQDGGSAGLTLVKAGPGTLYLGGANYFHRGLAIQNGILRVPYLNLQNVSGPLGYGPYVTLGSSGHTGTLESLTEPNMAPHTDMFFSIPTGATGALIADAPGEINESGGFIGGGGRLECDGGRIRLDSVQVSGGITVGNALLILTGSNSFIGGVLINAGELQLGNPGALNSSTPNAVTFAAGSTGILSLNGNSVTISGLNTGTPAGAPVVQNGGSTPATLTVNNASVNTFAGALQDGFGGALSLAKSGAGTLTLSSGKAYTGSTTVNGGTLRFALTSGSPTIGAGATATVASGATLELAGSVSALSSGSNRVNVGNSSNAPGLLVSGTHQQVGNIDGSGTTQVNAGSDLTANHIIQAALVIGGGAGSSAIVTIDASDSNGNPLASGLLLAGSLQPSGPFGAGVSSVSSIGDSANVRSGAAASALGSSSAGAGGAAVPEPSALMLLVLSALTLSLLAIVRRRTHFTESQP